jgi:hypothetical protein
MGTDYIQLSNGIKYRVEVNLNAIEAICRELGIDDFSRIDNLSAIKVHELKTLVHLCIAEGERMDNRLLPMDAIELAAYFRITTIQEFMAIFNRQSAVQVTQQKKRASINSWMRNWFPAQQSTT